VDKRSNDFTTLDVTIREGKNREVRRVFAAVGYKVVRLERTRIGTLHDRRLKEGEWRPLLREEIEELEALTADPARSEELMRRAAHGSRRNPRGRFGGRGQRDDNARRPHRDRAAHEGRRGAHSGREARRGGRQRT
jgi:hypothetical protein